MKPVKKIKVGKTYRVRRDLVTNEMYGIEKFVSHMEKMLGRKISFSEMYRDGMAKEDGYNYTPEMLEHVKKSKWQPIETAPIGEKIIISDLMGNKIYDILFNSRSEYCEFLASCVRYTHWRPRIKGPVVER